MRKTAESRTRGVSMAREAAAGRGARSGWTAAGPGSSRGLRVRGAGSQPHKPRAPRPLPPLAGRGEEGRRPGGRAGARGGRAVRPRCGARGRGVAERPREACGAAGPSAGPGGPGGGAGPCRGAASRRALGGADPAPRRPGRPPSAGSPRRRPPEAARSRHAAAGCGGGTFPARPQPSGRSPGSLAQGQLGTAPFPRWGTALHRDSRLGPTLEVRQRPRVSGVGRR